MRRQLRAELLKQRTAPTILGMAAAMVGVALTAVALHAFGLKASSLADGSRQLGVFVDVGENLGSLFAALFGAMLITGEIRHGTVRPTLLHTPQRSRVIVAKGIVALAAGAALGALATGTAAVAGTFFLDLRGIAVHIGAGDYALLVVGGAAAAALWAVIGLGAGAVVRAQVPTVVGLLVWILFIENFLSSVPSAAEYAPGTLGRALAGATEGTLLAPALAALLLSAYAAAAFLAGRGAITQRDVA